jgi:hypothetical protein
MAEQAKPAGANGGHREITIRDWKPLFKNTLRGYFSVDLPSGLRIHSLSLHQKGERRWIGLPARAYETDSGSTSWARVVEIPDRQTRERFEGLVLAALDRRLGAWQWT